MAHDPNQPPGAQRAENQEVAEPQYTWLERPTMWRLQRGVRSPRMDTLIEGGIVRLLTDDEVDELERTVDISLGQIVALERHELQDDQVGLPDHAYILTREQLGGDIGNFESLFTAKRGGGREPTAFLLWAQRLAIICSRIERYRPFYDRAVTDGVIPDELRPLLTELYDFARLLVGRDDPDVARDGSGKVDPRTLWS